jgi:hypothetical protein
MSAVLLLDNFEITDCGGTALVRREIFKDPN